MNYDKVAKTKRIRGVILEALQSNHDEQKSRFDSSMLWSFLVRGLGFDISENELKTVLQDLSGRGYIKFVEIKDQRKGLYWIVQIEMLPKGRDLLEGTISDSAVEV